MKRHTQEDGARKPVVGKKIRLIKKEPKYFSLKQNKRPVKSTQKCLCIPSQVQKSKSYNGFERLRFNKRSPGLLPHSAT